MLWRTSRLLAADSALEVCALYQFSSIAVSTSSKVTSSERSPSFIVLSIERRTKSPMTDNRTTARIGQIQSCRLINTPARDIDRPTLDLAHVMCGDGWLLRST